MWQAVKETMGLSKIIAFEVDHCPQSYGCCLVTTEHEKIIYSGDTLPCQNLVNYAMECKVFIHEATFDDSLEADAAAKKHTTTGQAIAMGKAVNAWRIILTHFSPRYSKIAECMEQHLENKALIAFDHLRVSMKNLEWAYNICDLYRKLLSNEDTPKEKPV